VNPSTALARTLVDELVRGGVREAVLAPGSRSAPLAFALHDACVAGRLRLHVRIDERSAAFLALGLAKASGLPVPVVTTSGTAVANLHPAVIEASYSGVPLLLLSADRPPELRGSGANQTVDQIKLYGEAVRLFVEVGAPSLGEEPYWRGTVCRALSAALGDLSGDPGPVHLNLAFREPLVPSPGEVAPGRPDGAPWTARLPVAPAVVPDDLPDRTVVVLGDGADLSVLELAASRGWPVVAEPSSGAVGPQVVDLAELVLSGPGWLDAHRPDRVLVVGRPTLSRTVGALIRSAPADVVAAGGSWPDAHHHATRVLPAPPTILAIKGRSGRLSGPSDPPSPSVDGSSGGAEAARDTPGASVDAQEGRGWADEWVEAGRRARAAVEPLLQELSEPHIAAAVADAAQGLLVVGSSKPVRDLFLAGGRPGLRVLANRGAAGIDGMVSTAVGAALAHGAQTYALLGDLTFLHDSNGLVLGPGEPRPDLTVVVVNNDGGAIFGLLEQGAPEHADAFERVFGTPHGVDLASLCAATGTTYTQAGTAEELQVALQDTGGLRVVEIRTDRTTAVELDRQLRAAVTAALSES
jgi:2-succinyl-5-enolpyruvyl-6-hydroxy-3-cyclohexene-1-carboxylate synthase